MDRLPDEIPQLQQRALLYAAGELPPEEAVEFEQQLGGDEEARSAVAEARNLLQKSTAGLEMLGTADAVGERSMRRARDRAVKAIFSWVEVEREGPILHAAHRHPLAEGMVWRYARWPLAAAALLVVGLMIWTFGSEPAQIRGVADGRTSPAVDDPTPPGNGSGNGSAAPAGEAQLDQIAALFDNPARDGSELLFAGGLSDELAALRLLEEADYE